MKIGVWALEPQYKNVAIEKIRLYYQLKGDDVENYLPLAHKLYDKVYVSSIFTFTDKSYVPDDADIGGTGFELFDKELPPEIEAMKPKINTGFTTRGCIRKCLDEDTLINTVHGMIPIKELEGKQIGVWTYNPSNEDVYITEATKVWYNGVENCVKITFDDLSYIICTPEHRFYTFKNGNQSIETRNAIKEAKDLTLGESVIALKHYFDCKRGIVVAWRRKQATEHRVVMRYKIGRKLKLSEAVHHLDGNRINNTLDNLVLCKNNSEHHIVYHSNDASERMKINNPMTSIATADKVREIMKTKYPKGTFHRSYEQKLRYRNSKLGTKNPNYKDGKTAGTKTRIQEVNHKVLSVEYVGKRNVYDIFVPETNWVFANNVLVHNCPFCVVPRKEGKLRAVGDIYDFWDGKSSDIEILDNNIMGLHDHFAMIWGQIAKEGLTLREHGLDIRILDEEKARILSTIKHQDYHFAFDNPRDEKAVVRGAQLLNAANIKRSTFYVLTGFDTTLQEDLHRLYVLKNNNQNAYVMRFKRKKELAPMASWANSHGTFQACDFDEFMESASMCKYKKYFEGMDLRNPEGRKIAVTKEAVSDEISNSQEQIFS